MTQKHPSASASRKASVKTLPQPTKARSSKKVAPSTVAAPVVEPKEGWFSKMAGFMKRLFRGADTPAEEKAEARAVRSGKISPKQYVAGEKAEGEKEPGMMARAKALKSGKMSPEAYAAHEKSEKPAAKKPAAKKMACGGAAKAKKMATGGKVRGCGAAVKGKTKGKMV